MKKNKIAIALSGGIDSLVSAYLLKDQGYNVVGIHFITGYEQQKISAAPPVSHPISSIGEQLGIPVHLFDCSKLFNDTVVKYFYSVYKNGQTPNPCMVCNPTIKFGAILNYAATLGATRLATGHYAKTRKDSAGVFHLLRAKDTSKDQSYFLAFLTQTQLSAARFPIGDMTKSAVRDFAEKKRLVPLTATESQDICFIRDTDYKVFLCKQLGIDETPGNIEDLQGTVIGRHKGLHRYTVGQRRGINIPSSRPYYVVKIDVKGNRLIVGNKEDLTCSEFKVRDINWIASAPANQISVMTRVRYRSKAHATTVTPIDKKTVTVTFKCPQSSVAPGQAAVFYKNNEVLGGGWILPH